MPDPEYCVAIADDEEDFREVLADRVEHELNLPVFSFESGEGLLGALASEQGFHPSVLVLDHLMGAATGIETFETIVRDRAYLERRDVRRMLLSGKISRQGEDVPELNRAKDAGIIHDFHRKKPEEIDDLIRVLQIHHRTFVNLQVTGQKDHVLKTTVAVGDGVELPLEIYLPVDLARAKGILTFTHGLGYAPSFYRFKWEELAAHDYLVALIGMRGHHKQASVFTVEAAVEDHNRLIGEIQRRYPFPANDRVYCISHSTGGLISQIAALQNPHIRATAWVSPLTHLELSFRHMFASGHIRQLIESFKKAPSCYSPGMELVTGNPESIRLLRDGRISREQVDHPGRYGTMRIESMAQFLSDVIGYPRTISDIGVKKPIFVVKGASDEIIPVAEADRLFNMVEPPTDYAGARDSFKRLYQTASTDHFQTGQWCGIARRSVEFFNAVGSECDQQAS